MGKLKTDWRARFVVILVAALAAGHVAAAWGLMRGLPEAPYGDESRFLAQLVAETLRIVWLPWQALSPDAVAPAGFARAILPLALSWLLLEWGAHAARSPLRLLRAVRRGGHDIFAGLSPVTLKLVEGWAAQGRSVIAVSDNAADRDAAVRGGGAALAGNPGAESAFRSSRLERAGTLVAAAGTDLENIDTAAAAADFVGRGREPDTPPLHILLQVDDAALRARIDERIDRFGRLDSVQLRLISASQIAARRLLRDYPLDSFRVGPAAPHVWIAGLGRMGEEIALSILRSAHYRHREPPRLTMIDRQAEQRRAELMVRWPGMDRVGTLRFVMVEAAAGAQVMESILAGAGDATVPPDAIYFCFERVEANVALAMALCQALEQRGWVVPRLFVRGLDAGLDPARLGFPEAVWVTGFGDAGWIADGILRVESVLDTLARHVHERYLSEAIGAGETLGARRALRPWTLLPEDLKDDNRNTADHHFIKIRDCGCRIVDAAAAPADFQFAPEEIEALAEVEHIRWLAVRELNGWRHGAVRDDAAKVHPDMVAYDQLGEDRRELDRAVVRGLPAALREVGLGIVRDLRITVTGPRSQWAFMPGFDAAVAAELRTVREAFPGRQTVLKVFLASALACRVGEIALDQGLASVSVCLAETPAALLSRCPDDAIRARVKRLLRDADSVLFVAVDQAVHGDASAAGGDLCFVLSIDGSDLEPVGNGWGVDAGGRVLFRPRFEVST